MEKRGTGRRNPLGMILDLAFALLSFWSRAAAGQHQSSPRILKVLLSSYSAELRLDGQRLDKPGFERIFKIPEEIVLPAGAAVIKLTVILKPNNYTTFTRTRRVNIAGGADMIIDLREEDPVKGRAFGSPLARGFYPRASTAEVDPQTKPGALTRDVNTRLSTAEADPQTKPALIRFANEDCKAWGPGRRDRRDEPATGIERPSYLCAAAGAGAGAEPRSL